MTEATETRRNPSAEFLYGNKWRIFGVMMIGWAMSLLDISIVNISIPTLEQEMSTDVANVTWVINAYNITFAILLVSMGRLADQFGRKRFFIIGLTVFTIGSALCATAAWSSSSSARTTSTSCATPTASTSTWSTNGSAG